MNLTDYPQESLAHYQKRGYLEYSYPDGTTLICSGWFWLSLDGRAVIRRKIGGRNCYRFTSVETAKFYRNDKAK